RCPGCRGDRTAGARRRDRRGWLLRWAGLVRWRGYLGERLLRERLFHRRTVVQPRWLHASLRRHRAAGDLHLRLLGQVRPLGRWRDQQIDKRGTNDWQFGGQVVYEPAKLRAEARDIYYPNLDLPDGYEYSSPDIAGRLYSSGQGEETSSSTYSAYV